MALVLAGHVHAKIKAADWRLPPGRTGSNNAATTKDNVR
jgi:hypothetical protein